MVKRIAILLSLFIVLSGVYVGYRYLKNKEQPVVSVFQAVPLDAAMVFETRGISKLFNKLQNESEIWNQLIRFPAIKKISLQIAFLDSIIENNPQLEKIQYKSGIFSVHHTGKNDVQLIYYFSTSPSGEEEIIHIIRNLLRNHGNITSREYNDVKVYSVSRQPESFDFCFIKGIFMLSYSPILLEEAIRQVGTLVSIDKQPGFKKVYSTAGKNVEANIYVNCLTFPRILSNNLSQGNADFIKNFTHFANWAELDINIKNDAILLNGFTYTSDSVNNYLDIFIGQEPQLIEMEKIIPADVSAFYVFGISNFELYRKNYNSYLERKRVLKRNGDFGDYSIALGLDFEEFFYSLLEQEFGLVNTSIKGLAREENIFTVFKTKSKSIAEENLLKVIEAGAEKQGKPASGYVSRHAIDNETKINIYQMPVEHFVGKMFGKILSKAEDRYYTFIDNYLVFGNSKNALVKFVYYSILKKTISTDAVYNEYLEYSSTQSNFYFFANPSNASGFILEYLNDTLQKEIRSNTSVMRKFPAFSFQFSAGKGLFYSNMALKYSEEIKESAHTAWECYLDTAIDFKPRLLTNHYTNGKEIFVQDLKNNLYLINAVGRTLWKKQIKEKIISDVYQVDFYKNNKLQILFSTKNYIYLIDRNGSFVEKYPVKLSSPATNGVSLFDYEKDKNYRMFVACENKNVYAFDIRGEIISGWEFDKTDHPVYSKIQHFLVGDKDYIVFADKNRAYILDRKGKERVKPRLNFSKSVNNDFTLEQKTTKTEPRLVCTDVGGIVYFIYFDGEVESATIKKYSPDHYFLYEDINADQYNDFIFVDGKKMEVTDQQMRAVFSYTFSGNINNPPSLYEFSTNNIKIGIVNSTEGNIYLFNQDGKIYQGFPLTGRTLFSVGNLNKSMNKFNLVVGNRNNLLYNYSVQ